MILRLRALLLLLCLVSAKALPHAGDALIPVRLAVAEWATAYQSDDLDALSSLLSDDFNGSPAAKAAYLGHLPMLPVKQVLLRYANYRVDHDTAEVTYVVYVPYRELRIPFSLNLTLRKTDGGWKITSIKESDDLPEDLRGHSARAPLCHLSVVSEPA